MDIQSILKLILEADQTYYSTGSTIMSDQEYDTLKDRLKELDPNHPIFEKVGNTPSSSWEKAEHEIPMGSQNKVHSEEDFRKWLTKFSPETIFTMQPKLDGLSLSLLFSNGEFDQGITRGDGSIGEDITQNVLKMRGLITAITLHLHQNKPMFQGSARSEIVLPKEDFERINSTLPEGGKYSNPRNAASGLSRRLDGKFCKYLCIITYDLLEEEKVIDEDKKIDYLRDMGFEVPNQIVGNGEDMVKAFVGIKDRRDKYTYGIDGVVVKACSAEIQSSMGVSNNRPKAQIAWKFDPPGAITKLREVSWDVGRTGVLTPLGHVEPVEIDGSIIKNVTLHNIAEISRLNIGLNDTVMLTKRGDIIPKIESVLNPTYTCPECGVKGTIQKQREIHSPDNPEQKEIFCKGKETSLVKEIIEFPETCPACNTELLNDKIRLICPSDNCPRKSFHHIMNWIKVAKIEEFGESLADALVSAGKLSSILDIYKLQESDISSIERWGGKSASKVMENINKSKTMPPELFLSAIGIPGISEKTSEELFAAFKTINGVLKASVEQIKKLKGFSDISSNSVVSGLLKFGYEINLLLSVISLRAKTNNKGKLTGSSFCFTGAMSKPRSFYQNMVKKFGGKSNSSVTKDLTYLVCNEDKGSTKSIKATKQGVKIISEGQFLDMVGEDVETDEPKIENMSLF